MCSMIGQINRNSAVKEEVEDWNRNQPPHQTVLKKDWCSTTKQAQFKLQIETLNCDGA